MEGFCRASSPPSIADSATRFNAKWPENRGFLYICDDICSEIRHLLQGLSTSPPKGCQQSPTGNPLSRSVRN